MSLTAVPPMVESTALMPTIFLSRTLQPESMRICGIASTYGWKVVLVPQPEKHVFKVPSGKIAVYAQPPIALDVARSWQLALIEPTFDLLVSIPSEYTLRDVSITTLFHARKSVGRKFIKPADCANKCFAARVYSGGEEIRPGNGARDSAMVLMSDPVSWIAEYRVIVCSGKY